MASATRIAAATARYASRLADRTAGFQDRVRDGAHVEPRRHGVTRARRKHYSPGSVHPRLEDELRLRAARCVQPVLLRTVEHAETDPSAFSRAERANQESLRLRQRHQRAHQLIAAGGVAVDDVAARLRRDLDVL